MKNIITLLLLALVSNNVYNQDFIWSNYFQGNKNVEPKGIAIDGFDNVYSLFKFEGTIDISGEVINAIGTCDIILLKTSNVGEILWYRQISGNGFDEPTDLKISASNEIYIIGMFEDSLFFNNSDTLVSTGGFDVFLAKYNINGNLEFARNIIYADDNSLQVALTLELDFTNSLIVGGYFSGKAIFDGATLLSNGFNTNYFAKFNKNGDFIWAKEIYGNNNATTVYNVIATNNSYYVAGVFRDSLMLDIDTLESKSAALDAFIYKMNLNGIGQWVRLIKGSGTENFSSISKDNQNNIYVIGYHNSLDFTIDSTDTQISQKQYIYNGGTDIFLAKYNSVGSLVWGQSFGGVSNDFGSDIITNSENVFITGQYSDFIIFDNDTLYANSVNDRAAYISKLSFNGEYSNSLSINGSDNLQDIGRYVAVNSLNEILVGGFSFSNTLSIRDSTYNKLYTGFRAFFLAKLGCLPISLTAENKTDFNCNIANGGEASISITGEGGFSQLLYSIDGGETFSADGNFTLTEPGEYNIVVKDSSGCDLAGSTLTITQPEVFEIASVDSLDVTFIGGDNGSISLTVTGGTEPYEFVMNEGTPQASADFTGLTAGSYRVVVQDANNCGPLDTDTITIEEPSVGLQKLGVESISVYPNPVGDQLNFEFHVTNNKKITVAVLDASGKVILSEKYRPVNGMVIESMDVSDLNEGVYFIRIGDEGEVLKVVKR